MCFVQLGYSQYTYYILLSTISGMNRHYPQWSLAIHFRWNSRKRRASASLSGSRNAATPGLGVRLLGAKSLVSCALSGDLVNLHQFCQVLLEKFSGQGHRRFMRHWTSQEHVTSKTANEQLLGQQISPHRQRARHLLAVLHGRLEDQLVDLALHLKRRSWLVVTLEPNTTDQKHQ